MRREFSKQVKRDAFMRANGQCEGKLAGGSRCGSRLEANKFHYDHELPDALGGEPELWNCQVLCVACHKTKTGKQDMPRIAKVKRIQDREKGIRRPRKITRWRRFDGSIKEAGRER